MALSENPKIAVIKNAIGGAYALLAAKEIGFNYTIAFSDATIAPLSSDQAVNFYDEKLSDNPQKDKEELKAKYTFAEGNPFKAAKDGYIDATSLCPMYSLSLGTKILGVCKECIPPTPIE